MRTRPQSRASCSGSSTGVGLSLHLTQTLPAFPTVITVGRERCWWKAVCRSLEGLPGTDTRARPHPSMRLRTPRGAVRRPSAQQQRSDQHRRVRDGYNRQGTACPSCRRVHTQVKWRWLDMTAVEGRCRAPFCNRCWYAWRALDAIPWARRATEGGMLRVPNAIQYWAVPVPLRPPRTRTGAVLACTHCGRRGGETRPHEGRRYCMVCVMRLRRTGSMNVVGV